MRMCAITFLKGLEGKCTCKEGPKPYRDLKLTGLQFFRPVAQTVLSYIWRDPMFPVQPTVYGNIRHLPCKAVVVIEIHKWIFFSAKTT